MFRPQTDDECKQELIQIAKMDIFWEKIHNQRPEMLEEAEHEAENMIGSLDNDDVRTVLHAVTIARLTCRNGSETLSTKDIIDRMERGICTWEKDNDKWELDLYDAIFRDVEIKA